MPLQLDRPPQRHRPNSQLEAWCHATNKTTTISGKVKDFFFLNTYLLPKGKRLLEIIISKSLFAEVSLTPYFCSGVGVQLHKMNLSSALKLFWQAIPEQAKVLEVGKAFPLLGSSASQQVWGLNLRLLSKCLTGLKGRALLLQLPEILFP